MKVALINPPYLIIYQKLNINQEASIPLGLLYVAGMLEKAGNEVRVFDPNLLNQSLPNLLAEVAAFKPEIIGFTGVTPTFNSCQTISVEFKKVMPHVPIIFGGPHVTSLPEKSLTDTPSADFIVYGEAENTAVELVKMLESGKKDFESIDGICFRRQGKVVVTRARDVIEDLDSIPFPAYHLVRVNDYAPSVVYRVKAKSIFVMSSRGCPASCTFCANNVTGRMLRTHSIEYFMELLRHSIREFGIRHFHIVDDNFNADQERTAEICRRIIDEKLNITFFIFARTDHCQDKELLKLLKRAGCTYIQFGIESGNVEILKQLGKKVTKESMYQACMNTKKAGIDYFNSFMIGNPKDTRETVLETIEYSIKLDSIMAGFNILIPYPGTPIFKKYYRQDIDKFNEWEKWNHITHDVPINYRHTTLTKTELDELRKLAIRRFYLRPRQIFRIMTFFKSFPLLFSFVASSWKHLFFLFAGKGKTSH